MQYLLLIYGNEQTEASVSKEEMDAVMADYWGYTRALEESGKMRGGDALHPTSSATTVRAPEGKAVITHGPFAETKEQLAGFYLLEARDLNEAIQVVSKIPPARLGCVEIRPIRELEPTKDERFASLHS